MGLASFTATLSHKTLRIAGAEPHATSDLSIFQQSQEPLRAPQVTHIINCYRDTRRHGRAIGKGLGL